MLKPVSIITLTSFFAFILFVAYAPHTAVGQEIRPTPTCSPEGCPTPGPVNTPAPPQAAASDEANGSIRGMVYEDKNRDGRCDSGEPTLAGIPLQFVSNDGGTTLFLQSGENGTYGLVAAGYGTWQVSANPPAPWLVRAPNPRAVFLGSEEPVATGINFCLTTNTAVSNPSNIILLPTAGASASNTLFLAALLLGTSFILAGLGLKRYQQI